MKISQEAIDADFQNMEERGGHGRGFLFLAYCILCVPLSYAIAHGIFWLIEMAIVYGGAL